MKFFSQPVPEHEEVPLADDGQWEELVGSWSQKVRPTPHSPNQRKRVYVLSVSRDRDPLVQQAQLAEILSLVRAQGDLIVGHEIYTLTKMRPRTLIGKGTSRAVAQRAYDLGATMMVIDAELSPSQLRNLEDEAGIPICDREAVILNVFVRHARSRHTRIQVEIAQLEYLRPRIRGIGLDMDQQTGGVAGSRGPGETASELLARKLDVRLAELRRQHRKLQKAGDNRRQRRQDCLQIALVGYTNAGKTALMNALTTENFSSADQPFETLDTVSRSLSRHGERILLSDTVGFIRRLPAKLLESFESTFSEVQEASLLAVVVDLCDHEWQTHLETTIELIDRLGGGHIPRLYVFNKIDKLEQLPSPQELEEVVGEAPYVFVSAFDEASVARLRSVLLASVRSDQRELSVFVPYTASEILNEIYGRCRVLRSVSLTTGLKLTIEGESRYLHSLENSLRELRK